MQSERLQQILYQIFCAINTTDDLYHLFEKIHQSLSEIIDVKNFYIALYDPLEEIIHFPYFIDEQCGNNPGFNYRFKDKKGSLTGLIIEKKEASIFSKEDIIAYCDKHKAEPSGPLCEIWMGVPLKVADEVIGVMAAQSYTDPDCYSENDLNLLNSISIQIAAAIDRKKNQTRYQNIVENIRSVIYTVSKTGKLNYISPSAASITGYTADELKNMYRWKCADAPDDQVNFFVFEKEKEQVQAIIKNAVDNNKPFETEYRIIRKDGEVIWVLERGQLFRDEMDNITLEGVITDIQKRKREEQISQAFFNISNAVNTAFDLKELCVTIHESLKPVINVEHFSIGFYYPEKDLIDFTFDIAAEKIEHPSEIQNASQTTSLSAEVIKQRRPLVFDRKAQLSFAASKGGKVIGTLSQFWLGVPLIVMNEVIGIMLTETLDSQRPYRQEDIDFFRSISDQVAVAIDKKRKEELVRTREKVITALYSISNAMHTTHSLHQLYQSIHKALADIVDVENFTIALYNWDTDILHFTYSSDTIDSNILLPIEKASTTGSLTYKVIHGGESLLFKGSDAAKYRRQNSKKIFGDMATKCWLGIPLKGKHKVLGAIINQSYHDPHCYTRKHVALLESVSDQIAFAIENKNAEADLISAQNELLEKAHKAGMADIAFDTIHNLGNILNSVKSSSELMCDILSRSHLESYNKAMDMLEDKIENLQQSIHDDPNCKKLLHYITKLEPSIVSEFSEINEQAKRISGKIALMTNVIRTQQNYVSEVCVEDDCYIADIVNKILKMHADVFENIGVKIVKDYSNVSKVLVQKTKLEHIIINILNNAKESMERMSNDENIIKVTLDQDPNYIYLRFKDSGEGIRKENLHRIFSQGFTTKCHGYGFGLHNAANFLAEMKGKIWAESEGPGTGATLVLQFQKR